MIDKSDWRLVNDVVAYVIKTKTAANGNDGALYLASSEKKSYENAVLKQIDKECVDKFIIDEDNKFNLIIDKNFDIFVKSDALPGGKTRKYKVLNVYSGLSNDYFADIFSQVENIKGDFEDKEFEAIFSDSFLGKVFFVNDEMDFYKDAFQEMRRRINCQICKKTKKWIPGHRYDSETITYYYLGEFVSRRVGENAGEFLENKDVVTVHLVSREIDKDDKTISDVLKKRTIGISGSDIQILYTSSLPSMVDSGEVLENDVTNIEDYWDFMVKVAIDKFVKNEFGFISYKSIMKKIFNIFSIQSRGNLDYNLSCDMKKALEDVIKNNLIENMVTWWDLSNSKSDSSISSANTVEMNTKNLENLFFRNFIDGNIHKNKYYPALFLAIGLTPLEKIIENLIINYNVDNLVFNSGFSNYIKFGSYYYNGHDLDKCNKQSKQRVNSTNYNLKVVTIESLFSSTPDLEKTIKDISKKAIENYGLGVKEFRTINIGSKKSPMIYTSLVIDINDIVDYYGGIYKVPQNIINDIITSRFWTFSLDIDKDAEVK